MLLESKLDFPRSEKSVESASSITWRPTDLRERSLLLRASVARVR